MWTFSGPLTFGCACSLLSFYWHFIWRRRQSGKPSSGSIHLPVWAFITCPGFIEPVSKRNPKYHSKGGESLQCSCDVVHWKAFNATGPNYLSGAVSHFGLTPLTRCSAPCCEICWVYWLRMSLRANTCVTSLLLNILLLRIGIPSALKRDHLHLITMSHNRHRAGWPSVLHLSLVDLCFFCCCCSKASRLRVDCT